jgi:uncharacterized protein YndB with AHSA1/START domain
MEKELVITRVFNAPVALVWQAWTIEENIVKWWGPKGFTTKVVAHDFRPGGRWNYIMVEDKSGNEYPAIGVFKDIVTHKMITSSDDFDEFSKATAAFDFPKILLFTVRFETIDNATKVTLIYNHASTADRDKHLSMGVMGGWNSSLDKLVELLEVSV